MTNFTRNRKIEIHRDIVEILKTKGDEFKEHLEHIQDCLDFLIEMQRQQIICWECIDKILKENNKLKTKEEVGKEYKEIDGKCSRCNENKKVFNLTK
jgi:hypothetical protein